MSLLPKPIHLIYNVTLGTVFTVGMVGNILVLLAALTQHTAHKAVNAYLANLAFADVLHLLSAPALIHLSVVNSWQWGRLGCKIYYMTHYINWTSSIFIIVAMGFDRYVAVAAPGCGERFRTGRFARLILAGQWVLSALVMTPMLLSAEVSTLVINGTNETLHSCGYVHNASTDNSSFWSVLNSFVLDPVKFGEYTFVIGWILPALLLAIFYGLILRRLHPGSRPAATAGPRAHQRFERVTKMAIAVVVFYAVCSTPHWIHVHLVLYMYAELNHTLLILSSHITTLLGYVNSAGNPILYAYFNDPFRIGVRKFLACLLAGGRRRHGPAASSAVAWSAAADVAASSRSRDIPLGREVATAETLEVAVRLVVSSNC